MAAASRTVVEVAILKMSLILTFNKEVIQVIQGQRQHKFFVLAKVAKFEICDCLYTISNYAVLAAAAHGWYQRTW